MDTGLLIAIFAAVIVVAVLVILYFLIFRKKIKDAMAMRKEENEILKARQQAADNKAMSLAGNVFGDRQAEEDQKRSEKEARDNERIAERDKGKMTQQEIINARNFGSQSVAQKAVDEETKKEKDKVPENEGYKYIMGQFSTQNASAPVKKADAADKEKSKPKKKK